MLKSTTNNRTKQQGISLLEAIIAIVILLFGILMMIKIFPLSLKVSQAAEQATIATNLAQAKMEEIFYLDYDNITIGTIETRHRLSTDPDNPFYYFERETISEYVDDNLIYSASETELIKITTTVFYNSPILSLNKNIQLISVIGQK